MDSSIKITKVYSLDPLNLILSINTTDTLRYIQDEAYIRLLIIRVKNRKIYINVNNGELLNLISLCSALVKEYDTVLKNRHFICTDTGIPPLIKIPFRYAIFCIKERSKGNVCIYVFLLNIHKI